MYASIFIPYLFKVGDKVRYKTMPNIGGTITEINGGIVIDNCLLAIEKELELTIPLDYGSTSCVPENVIHTKQPCNCDWNDVLRYGCKNANHY